MFKNLWALVRPYLTVARVTTAVTAALTPPAALLAGKIAVVLASWGIALDETQTTAVFIAGAAAVVAAVVPLVRKFIDNRTAFETALIQNNQASLIQGKALNHLPLDLINGTVGGSPGVNLRSGAYPGTPSSNTAYGFADDLSAPGDDLVASDVDDPDAPERYQRDDLQ